MPSYRSIVLSLVSQFDILNIPEFPPPTNPSDPFSTIPSLLNPDQPIISVYIPTYPSSQFWLSYSVSPPHPPNALYYFKLYLNGSLITSWGCGESDGYRGKTMFGCFDSGQGLTNTPLVQRRVLCFGSQSGEANTSSLDTLKDVMEIKVFRSKGRKRIKPELREFPVLPHSPPGNKKGQQQRMGEAINLVNAGYLPNKHPQRYYKYALLDPLDQPFAAFRYYYRSWDQLEALGVISPSPSVESSSVRSLAPAMQPNSPGGSNHTLASYISVSASSDNATTEAVTHSNDEPKDNSFYNAEGTTPPIITNGSTTNKISRSPSEDKISPLKIPFLTRPPTPPPSSASSKLAQLPNKIPPTLNLNILTSKESFTSLIRNHLPSPDRSNFQLTDLYEDTPRPPSPSNLPRLNNLGVLTCVVNSAKNRRRKNSGSSAGSSEEAATSKLQKQRSEEGEVVGGKDKDEETKQKDRLVEKEREKKRNAREGRKKKGEGRIPVERGRRREGRKLNLWEQL